MNSADELVARKGSRETWTPLLERATREVFELMLGCQLSVPAAAEEPTPEITAIVGLAGQLCGVLSVRCDRHAAALMASKMLGVELEQVGAAGSDAIGEVCNMVAGNFKNKIAGLAEGCLLTPPTVVTGSNYSLHSLADSPSLELSLLFEHLPIVVCLEIHS
jgi:chemotaxis protein CheX